MATWKPDPTFYPSPKLAMTAPREAPAYVAVIDPERRRPDALAVLPAPLAVLGAAALINSAALVLAAHQGVRRLE